MTKRLHFWGLLPQTPTGASPWTPLETRPVALGSNNP